MTPKYWFKYSNRNTSNLAIKPLALPVKYKRDKVFIYVLVMLRAHLE